ncbi:MAG: hypothetical protein PHQ04_01265 [Opitutaceae bacterium]|nr:hypothetical protein [Opitutaceae bacterium]
MTAALSQDRHGIGYSGMQYQTPALKPLAISPEGSSDYIMPTRKSVQSFAYPLSRSLYMLTQTPVGKPLEPKVK